MARLGAHEVSAVGKAHTYPIFAHLPHDFAVPMRGSVGSGLVSSKAPWTKNRVYYARTPGQAAGWLPYVTQRDRRSLEHLNFSKSGVFAIFFKGPGTGPVNVPHARLRRLREAWLGR